MTLGEARLFLCAGNKGAGVTSNFLFSLPSFVNLNTQGGNKFSWEIGECVFRFLRTAININYKSNKGR